MAMTASIMMTTAIVHVLMTLVAIMAGLFYYGLFNNFLNSSHYVVSNDK
jgi:hypothetical protein